MFPPSRNLRKTCFPGTRSSLAPGLPFSFEPTGPRIRVRHVSNPLGTQFRWNPCVSVCLATIVVRGKRTPDSSSPRLRSPEKPISVKSDRIGCLATIVVRGKRTPDSSSPSLNTPWEPNFGEIRVYRLPSNHCRPRETDPGFEFPASNYPWNHRSLSQLASFPAMFFWPGDRQTNRQTDKQTNFNFVRPSFQSREWRRLNIAPLVPGWWPWQFGSDEYLINVSFQ